MLAGFRLILGSPYLAGIATWVALLSLAGTFLYFIQQDVVRAASSDPATRTRIFAAMDLGAESPDHRPAIPGDWPAHQAARRWPRRSRLAAGFCGGLCGTCRGAGLAAIVVFQTLQRTINFAFSNPAREILFTSVAREEKYKAKNLIDTVVFRGGDVVWSWTFAGLLGLVGSPLRVAMLAIPVMIGWAGLALALGRKQEKKIAAPEEKQA